MTETTDKGKSGKLSLSKPGTLELNKTVESGQVRQNFSHGRSKMVQVERRTKRTFALDSGGKMLEVKARAAEAEEALKETIKTPDLVSMTPVEGEAVPDKGPADNFTTEERAARDRARADAEKFEVDRQRQVEEDVRLARRRKEGEEDPKVKGEFSERVAVQTEIEAEEALVAELAAEAGNVPEPSTPEAAKAREARARATRLEEEAEEGRARSKKAPRGEKRPSPSARKGDSRRRSGKLTISEALEEREERQASVARYRRKLERERQKGQQLRSEGQRVIRDVTVPEAITVQELANRMAERAADVIKTLMGMGVMVTATQTIDADTAELVIEEFGHKIKRVSEADVEDGLGGGDDDQGNVIPRAPIVTVMGHVDHGKTSLLDALRESDIAGGEAGGITQHIGAYQVEIASGDKISFIDTPGHAAFTEMRARGAQVTDIVVLCVAADDGIMPQTIEAIHHAKAAGVPIIVAINKIDKIEADANRVRTELLQHDLQVEEMGGDILSVEVSALEKTNLDKLGEAILLQSELLDLMANPDRMAEGVVVESKMEQGRGSVSTVLVQRGTLRVGDIFVAGSEWGRVRAMVDAHGKHMEFAGPSVPVEVLGLNGTPDAGDEVVVVDSEGRAREICEFRARRKRDANTAVAGRGTIEQMFEKIKEGEAQTLPVVLKGDVHGSVEAIAMALQNIANDEVRVQVLHSAVGGINESDVTLARASGAPIIAFNVRANPQARDLAKRDGVDIRYYSIIYDLTDDMKKMLSGMLAPEVRETFLGYAEIKEVFSVSKIGRVAGCLVTEGQVKRGSAVRLIRDEVVIHQGDLSQLKRFKDDVKEVISGTECGVAFANYQDIQSGDIIECFDVEEVARQL
ncbi:MAG: translation initiation factor IF-2 [Rhodospirillaceae bacterium TMED8]|nr:translation initiation factor IF-2 [Magnetovibrio sp.]OUT50441.1 MAG: translation initiation factor IF-2 [Rhodospirillaceae bacterium TMED8]